MDNERDDNGQQWQEQEAEELEFYQKPSSGHQEHRLHDGIVLYQHKQEINMDNDLNSLSFTQLVPTQSQFLKKDDVGEDGVILTIKGFSRESIKGDNGDEEKVVMHFIEEGYKPMVLNNTNAAVLGKITGASVAGEARGKRIVVYDDPSVSFGGKVTGGLRLKRVQGQPAAPRAARKPDQVGQDDDIPF